MKRWLVRAGWAAVPIFGTVVIGGAVDARRRLSDLESWHRYVPPDATASNLERATLADYLRREDTVFRDVRDRIERTSAGSASPPANRYDRRSRSYPSRLGWDGNRTYEQSWRLTTEVQAQILRLGKSGRLKELPPVLAFQSLVDATVSTDAVVHALFDQLDGNGSELVLFDINRLSGMEPFIDPASATILSRLTDASARRYGRALVTNADHDSLDVVERSIRADQTEIVTRPLGLAWPSEMFSLAHIALPFTVDDAVYGRNPLPSSSDVVRLGTLSPRGERAVLTVPLDTLMRVSCNPFFPYLSARLTAWMDKGKSARGAPVTARSRRRSAVTELSACGAGKRRAVSVHP